MKLRRPIQILYGFEIRQILSPVIMPKITKKRILDFTVFERKNQFVREKEKFNSSTCQSTVDKFLWYFYIIV